MAARSIVLLPLLVSFTMAADICFLDPDCFLLFPIMVQAIHSILFALSASTRKFRSLSASSTIPAPAPVPAPAAAAPTSMDCFFCGEEFLVADMVDMPCCPNHSCVQCLKKHCVFKHQGVEDHIVFYQNGDIRIPMVVRGRSPYQDPKPCPFCTQMMPAELMTTIKNAPAKRKRPRKITPIKPRPTHTSTGEPVRRSARILP